MEASHGSSTSEAAGSQAAQMRRGRDEHHALAGAGGLHRGHHPAGGAAINDHVMLGWNCRGFGKENSGKRKDETVQGVSR